MAIELKCDCGNPDCWTEIMFRRGPVFMPDGYRIDNGFHIDACDMRGKSVELILEPRDARHLAWWLIKNFWRRK